LGERSRNIGIEAEKAVKLFLKKIGYEIEDWNNEEYNLDGIIKFSDKTIGLKKPIYSPEGLTAVEITDTELRSQKIHDFKDKINNYNENNINCPINGGIILAQGRLSDRIKNYAENENIFCWDICRRALYHAKTKIFGEWIKSSKAEEIILSDEITYLRRFQITSPEKPLIYFSIFYDTNRRVSSSLVKSTIIDIKKVSLDPLINLNYLPINCYFEFHSIEGFSIEEKELRNYIKDFQEEGVFVMLPSEDSLKSYRSFPEIRT